MSSRISPAPLTSDPMIADRRRLKGSISASSASATIGVTRRARIAGQVAVTMVTPMPMTIAVTTVHPLMITSDWGR